MLCPNHHSDVAGDDFRPHITSALPAGAELALPVHMQARPWQSWLMLQLLWLFHSPVTKSTGCDKDHYCGCDKNPCSCDKEHCGVLLLGCWQNPLWSSAALCSVTPMTHFYAEGVFLANLEGSEDQGFPFEVQQLTPLSWVTTPPWWDCQSKNINKVKVILQNSFFISGWLVSMMSRWF